MSGERKRLRSAKVRNWLKESGQKTEWLALQLGVHYNSVRGYTERDRLPHADTLLKLAQIMGVEPKDLIK